MHDLESDREPARQARGKQRIFSGWRLLWLYVPAASAAVVALSVALYFALQPRTPAPSERTRSQVVTPGAPEAAGDAETQQRLGATGTSETSPETTAAGGDHQAAVTSPAADSAGAGVIGAGEMAPPTPEESDQVVVAGDTTEGKPPAQQIAEEDDMPAPAGELEAAVAPSSPPPKVRGGVKGLAGDGRFPVTPSAKGTKTSGAPYGSLFFQHYGVNPFIATADDTLSTFALDVDSASYASLRHYIGLGHLPPPEQTRAEEFVNFFKQDYPFVDGDFGIFLEGASSRFSPGYTLLRIGIKTRSVKPQDRMRADTLDARAGNLRLQTVARDAKVQVEFDPERVVSYRLLGFENPGSADRDFRDDSVDARELGAGHEVTALYEVKLARGVSRGTIATVRLRYTPPGREGEAPRRAREIARSFEAEKIEQTFNNASPRFRLDAAAAEFAEILRHSYWAKETRIDDLKPVARRLARELYDDPAVVEFASLLDRAASLSERLSPEERERRRREDAASPAGAGTPILLGPGESAGFGAIRVGFDRLVSDSRCPPNVRCVWEGEARVALMVEYDGSVQRIELSTRKPRSANVAGREIELLRVLPEARGSARPVEESEVLIEIAVHP